MGLKAVFFDLDDTLYTSFQAGDAYAYEKLEEWAISTFGDKGKGFADAFRVNRKRLARQQPAMPPTHDRVLFAQGALERMGLNAVRYSREAFRVYWDAVFAKMTLRPGVAEFLDELRAAGVKVAICTNMLADIQMEKLEPRVSRSVNQDAYDDDTLPWNKNQSRLGVSKFGMKSNSYASRTASYVSGTGDSACSGFGGVAGQDLSSIFDRKPANASSAGQSAKPVSPGFGKAFTVQKPAALDYSVGDRVRHIKFGEGTVLSVKDGTKDFEVSVNFDTAGVKKMFASFAKLQKL